MARSPRGRSLPTRLALGARLVLVLAGIAGSVPANGEESTPPEGTDATSSSPVPGNLTLSAAVTAALADGHRAQIAQLETDRSLDTAGQERSAYLPRASVTSNAGYNSRWNDKLVAVDGSGQVKRYGLSSLGSDEGWFNVYLDQLLVDLATWQRIERAELEAEATALAQEQEREAVAYEVVQRFTEALRQERLAALARERVTATEALDQQAAVFFGAGRTRPADREQVALLLEEARLDAASRAADVESARTSLALAMGRDGGAPGDPLDAASLPDTHAAATSEPDVVGAPELRVLDLRRRVEEKGIAIARAGHLPTVALRAGYSRYGVKRFDNYPDAAQLGVNVDIPLFQGLKNEYAVEGATKSAEIARVRYRAALESKRARVRDLTRRLASGTESPDFAERRAGISGERLRLAELNLRADRGSLDAVLGALGDSVRDGRAAVDTELDRVVLWAELHRETGTLAHALGVPPLATQPSQN